MSWVGRGLPSPPLAKAHVVRRRMWKGVFTRIEDGDAASSLPEADDVLGREGITIPSAT
jgi:hypothetical protein